MIVRIRPASIYSSTDSRGILRSRSALTARSLSLGASPRARCTSSSPVGMLFTGAAEDSVSTALMRSLPFLLARYARLRRAIGAVTQINLSTHTEQRRAHAVLALDLTA